MRREAFRSQIVLHGSKTGGAAGKAMPRTLTSKPASFAGSAAATAMLQARTSKLRSYAGSAAAKAMPRALTTKLVGLADSAAANLRKAMQRTLTSKPGN